MTYTHETWSELLVLGGCLKSTSFCKPLVENPARIEAVSNFIRFKLIKMSIVCDLPLSASDGVDQEKMHNLGAGSRTMLILLLRICCLISLLLPQLVGADIALPVERCNATGCTIINAYGTWLDRTDCQAASVMYPKTEQDIINAVATAVKNNQKIKVGTEYGHSFPKWTCPGSDSGMIISTKNYTSIVSIDTSAMTVTAESGIIMRDLLASIASLTSAQLVFPVSPYWDAVSLGGVLAMGAHGSSHFGKGGAVHEYVVGMRMVIPATAAEGFAKVVELSEGGDEDGLNAAKVSLGVLGIVSTVILQLEPAFKRSVTLEISDTDEDLEDMIFELADNYEFGDAIWYPSRNQVVYRKDNRVPLSTPGDGVNRFFAFQPRAEAAIELARSLEDIAEALRDEDGKCLVAIATISSQQLVGYGFEKNAGSGFQGFPVIGQQHQIMAASGCESSTKPENFCPWDRRVKGLLFYDDSAAIPMQSLKAFIGDMKALRDTNPDAFCGLDVYTGFYIRFVKKSGGAYLGAQEDVAMVDFTYYRSTKNDSMPRLNGDLFDEIEQTAFFKYGAKPHWGKNRNYAFEGVAKSYADIDKFLAAKARFDPQGFLSNEWTDAVLGIAETGGTVPGVTTIRPSCAIEGLCVCTQDVHCAPQKNYFCRQGKVYSGANVCRFEEDS